MLLAEGAAYLSDRAVFRLRVACRLSRERVRSCRGERPVSAVESETGRRGVRVLDILALFRLCASVSA